MKFNNTNDTDGLMNTIIGKDTTITGTLDVKGALRVDGCVKGKIICSDCVTIGATGEVEAEIEANAAIIAGHMVGNISTTDKIELQAKQSVHDNLFSSARKLRTAASAGTNIPFQRCSVSHQETAVEMTGSGI